MHENSVAGGVGKKVVDKSRDNFYHINRPLLAVLSSSFVKLNCPPQIAVNAFYTHRLDKL